MRHDDLNIDLSGRNAILDLLDFDVQTGVEDNIKHLIMHAISLKNESKMASEIVKGVFGHLIV